MMDNGGNLGKEPLVRAVSDPVYVFIRRPCQVGPSLRDDGPDTRGTDSFEDDPNNALRVIKHNAPESDVYGRRTG